MAVWPLSRGENGALRQAGRASAADLASRWREGGDEHARDELFTRFLPLARKLAFRYRSSNEPFEDLVQVAAVGLLGAINRFEPQHDVSFASFAIPTILGELKRHFRNTGWSVHVPRRAQELALRVDRASRQIEARTGRSPVVSEIAEYLEIEVEDVLSGLEAAAGHHSSSLDAPAPGSASDDAQSLGESLGISDDGLGLVETRLSFATAISELPYLERQALLLRIGRDMKQVDIARHLDCSQMQVSRLLRRAADQLKRATNPNLDAQSDPKADLSEAAMPPP
jgi:RNA polymerase sigma-B factor